MRCGQAFRRFDEAGKISREGFLPEVNSAGGQGGRVKRACRRLLALVRTVGAHREIQVRPGFHRWLGQPTCCLNIRRGPTPAVALNAEQMTDG